MKEGKENGGRGEEEREEGGGEGCPAYEEDWDMLESEAPSDYLVSCPACLAYEEDWDALEKQANERDV